MKNCICYVIDDVYLFPTLVSAMQARKHVAKDLADVVIGCIAEPSKLIDVAERAAREHGIDFILVPPSTIDHMHPMFGRLFINRILPEGYGRIVYIDGDTQIAGPLQSLIEKVIPDGSFLAVRDPSNMFARTSRHWLRLTLDDRKHAGLTTDYDNYFNTGVMVFERRDWAGLSEKVLDLVRARKEPFRYGDQDPMNVAIGDRCVFMSNKWNFPGFLIGSPMERAVEPVIYHFMSNPRPWVHAVAPWGEKWGEPYRELLQSYPELAPLSKKASTTDKLKYQVQQFIKYMTEYKAVGNISESKPDINI